MAAARARGRRARAVRGARLRRPARRGTARSARPRRSQRRRCARSTGPESMAELERGEAAPDLRRVPAHAGRARRPQARARGRAVGHRATTSTAPLVGAFIANLPFALTGDQQRTIAEITHDMASPAPMHRLLQGDVGSGKTVVALAALLVGVQGGYQGAFMAPTEVLAEQHYLGVAAAARRADGPRRRARCSANGRCGSSCSPTARPRPSGGGSRSGARRRRGRHPRRHARAALRRRRVHAGSVSR